MTSCSALRTSIVQINLQNSVYIRDDSVGLNFSRKTYTIDGEKAVRPYSILVKGDTSLFLIDKEIIVCPYPETPSEISVDNLTYKLVEVL